MAELMLIYLADDGLVEASHGLGETIMARQALKGTQNVINALHELAGYLKDGSTDSKTEITQSSPIVQCSLLATDN
eukprot:2197423-Amphidinium_carterae.3